MLKMIIEEIMRLEVALISGSYPMLFLDERLCRQLTFFLDYFPTSSVSA
jgi:hypothetical protein